MSDKDLDQLRQELSAKLAEYLKANGYNLASYDSAARFDGWVTGFNATNELVGVLTAGWSVDKTMLDLDKDKILRDPAAPLRNPGDDYDETRAEKRVIYEISTAHRPLTDAERTALEESDARWKAVQEQRSTLYRWERGDQESPPPDGTAIGTLLNYEVWWLTKDKRVIRIAEMEPSHRANLLRLMLRNADAWKEVELHRFLAQGAPDDVTSSAEYLTGKNWLAEKPLFQALRKLVLIDQVGANACLIEWSDDKPVGCLTGADGHVCALDAGHKKRCSCRCGARPAKTSTAAERARAARQQALVNEMLPQLFPEPSPSTGKTVQQETVQRFMDLGAARRFDESEREDLATRIARGDFGTGDELTAEDIH